MAQTKISALTELAAAPADADELVIVDKSDTTMAGTGTDKKITYVTLVSALRSDITTLQSNVTTLQGQTPNAILTTAGDIIYASANGVAARLAKGTAYQRLRMNAGATAPEWGALVLTSDERGTSLPGSPVDGQRYNYIVDDVNGVEWALVYDTSQAKWRYVGGPPLRANISASEAVTGDGAWHDATTVGPAVTVPLAGLYLVAGYAGVQSTVATAVAYVGACIGAGTPGPQGMGQVPGASYWVAVSFSEAESLSANASDSIRLRYNIQTGTCAVQKRGIVVFPQYVS